MRKKKDKYQVAYQTYKIVCNNSVNGGDCRGETYCNNCAHKDFWCDKHRVMVCNCCYKYCPPCKPILKKKEGIVTYLYYEGEEDKEFNW